MRRLAVIALCLAGCAQSRGARVGVAPDVLSRVAGELLHSDLVTRPAGAQRVSCDGEVDCLSQLRSGRVDLVALERESVASLLGEGLTDPDLVVLTELPLARRRQLVVAPNSPATSIAELGASRVAVSSRFAHRASRGFADLARTYRLGEAPAIIDDPAERAAALERGVVAAAVFERWRRPLGTRPLPDPAGALEGGPLVVIAARHAASRAALDRAAGAAAVRLGEIGDRILAAVAAGADPIAAVRAVAPINRSPEPLVLAAAGRGPAAAAVERALALRSVRRLEARDPLAALARGGAALALAPRSPSPPAGAELVAVFEPPGGVARELWARPGTLDLAEARRVLEASPIARLPSGERPSLWRRLSRTAPPPTSRPPSRWLDTLANVVTFLFLVWLVVRVVRRGDVSAIQAAAAAPEREESAGDLALDELDPALADEA